MFIPRAVDSFTYFIVKKRPYCVFTCQNRDPGPREAGGGCSSSTTIRRTLMEIKKSILNTGAHHHADARAPAQNPPSLLGTWMGRLASGAPQGRPRDDKLNSTRGGGGGASARRAAVPLAGGGGRRWGAGSGKLPGRRAGHKALTGRPKADSARGPGLRPSRETSSLLSRVGRGGRVLWAALRRVDHPVAADCRKAPRRLRRRLREGSR